jgi:hypothetical protein
LVLNRLRLGEQAEDGARREQFIQDLVHDRPEVIPMADIEPAFAPLIPICRELPTPAGYLDNLWLTPAGGIVLGECKLVRNPQARREVVSQGLDYARAISTWGYEDLDAGVRKALGSKAQSIWSLMSDHTDLTEDQFVDAVGRRLKLGRFLVLIIGDGIQEGVEALTAFLQLHAGLHAGIALVDLSIWHGVDGGLLVVPRVPMRTVLIERGIVTVDASGEAKVNPPPAQGRAAPTSKEPRALSASEPEFFDQLEARRPGVPVAIQGLAASLADLGVSVEFKKTMLLRLGLAGDEIVTLLMIDNFGKTWWSSAWASLNKMGLATIADGFQAAIASLAGGQVRHYQTSSPPEVLGSDGKSIDVSVLLDHQAALHSIFADLITAVTEAVEKL